ncbi:ABC transporter ATP-binding protein [Kribbella solani]|uniref:ABC transporter ATP-binding protein n=1 Tax=Kribbella solani TaxID=236067 RepID=UPI0029AEEFF0|nr:ABC transporter ATP-binding protein [Kribbella solani]MDX2969182.1 ABC transporter ATP-binding protein [Kribbella solani]MDX3006295.1 ABC transporter ATP-binding protein [Kribbella solani]
MRLVVRDVGVVVDGLPILAGVELTVQPGEFVAIIGPNGAGKSTLLRAIYRALRPTTGTVLLGDDDVWRTPAKTIARRRAVVTQHQTMAADFTVDEMVGMGRTPHKSLLDRETRADRDIVERSLAKVDLAGAGKRLFSTLSGGERQRVLVARALAQQAPLIVLDEPTNHLDVRAQLDLLHLVRGLGTTTVAALHDLDQAAAHADRVAVLQSGRLVAEGPPLEVLTVDLIESVFEVRAHISTHPIHGRPHIAVAPLNR